MYLLQLKIGSLLLPLWDLREALSLWKETKVWDLYSGFGEELAGQLGVEGGGHGDDGQVLGADTAVLPRHVRVKRIPWENWGLSIVVSESHISFIQVLFIKLLNVCTYLRISLYDEWWIPYLDLATVPQSTQR